MSLLAIQKKKKKKKASQNINQKEHNELYRIDAIIFIDVR
jgi:hypothetical protein